MKYLVANWKSNKSRDDVEEWMERFEAQVAQPEQHQAQIILCPPMPSLMYVSNRLLDRKVFSNAYLGVQDVSPYPAGSYTGAVSTYNLDGFNVQYALVGHSERRRYFHETSLDVAKKVRECVDKNITPIVCIDEPYLLEQAETLEKKLLEKCLVAYEPLAAIGSGDNAPVEKVIEMVERVHLLFGEVPVLYGGSVDSGNAQDYLAITDGVLVGGASLDVAEFGKMISKI